MKRKALIKHLEKHGCELLREGGKHTVTSIAKGKATTIPRHRKSTSFPKKICRDLEIPDLHKPVCAQIILYTTFALVAFAFKTRYLCRLALRADEIDAASFTSVRLISGAVTLSWISYFFRKAKSRRPAAGRPPFSFCLAVCFHLAYISLTPHRRPYLFGSVQ